MFSPVQSACAAGCGLCFRTFYHRQPVLVELGWALYDVMGNINHGMEFCSLPACYIFILAGVNVCYPLLLRSLSMKRLLKHLLLSALPFITFSLFWRPLNFLLLFLMRTIFDHIECEDVYLRGISYLCAISIFVLSLLFSRIFQSETAKPRRGAHGFAHRRPQRSHPKGCTKVVRFSSSRGSMHHNLRDSHEYKKTRSGCVYGEW